MAGLYGAWALLSAARASSRSLPVVFGGVLHPPVAAAAYSQASSTPHLPASLPGRLAAAAPSPPKPVASFSSSTVLPRAAVGNPLAAATSPQPALVHENYVVKVRDGIA